MKTYTIFILENCIEKRTLMKTYVAKQKKSNFKVIFFPKDIDIVALLNYKPDCIIFDLQRNQRIDLSTPETKEIHFTRLSA